VTFDSEDIPLLGKLTDDVCLSGGARGADITWGNHALKKGHQVVHWSFKGHKSWDKDNTYILTPEELKESDIFLKEANVTMKRRLNLHNEHVANLLRRNWYQVKYVDSLYVVGSLNEKAIIYDPREGYSKKYHLLNDRKDRMGVNGGTGWACQLYLDRYRRNYGEMDFNLTFYDQIKQDIFKYSPKNGCWVSLNRGSVNRDVTTPSGIYAAIGSRDLNEHGAKFIENIYNKII